MKTILKIMLISAPFLGTLSIQAQDNEAPYNNDLYREIVQEMPSLNFTGNYDHKIIEKQFVVTEDIVNTTYEDTHVEILKEMPSLDFLGEHKYSLEAEESYPIIASQKDIIGDDSYKKLEDEMPSLKFIN